MPIDALVNPRSIAIVGATDRTGPARSVIESLGALGFTGKVYPVNPKYPSVLNHTCYPSLTDLPEAPDVVVFSIRNPLIPEQVRLAIKRGARAAVPDLAHQVDVRGPVIAVLLGERGALACDIRDHADEQRLAALDLHEPADGDAGAMQN